MTSSSAKRRGIPPLPDFILLITRRRIDENGCWIWNRKARSNGYAYTFRRRDGRRRVTYIHRLSHETFIGPIPDGYEVDHLCRVRDCYNPDHLEAVTPLENARRAKPFRKSVAPPNKGTWKEFCIRGHRRVPGKDSCDMCRTERYYHDTGRYNYLSEGPEALSGFILG